jgi:membrane associated rhomboid family serine protease
MAATPRVSRCLAVTRRARVFPIQSTVPTRYPAVVTWILIAGNCAIFFVQLGLSPPERELFMLRFALIPARYFTALASNGPGETFADYLPLVTNTFLHGGWLHLISNMWTLWLFGPAVEDRLGSARYLVFYLTCGVLASAAHVMFNPLSVVPALGASGAIAGVLGCYARLFPFARVVVLVPILFLPLFFSVPAIAFVGLWFLLQILQGTVELFTLSTGGGVAWWAHVGGFLAGLALGPLLARSALRHRPYYPDEGILGFDHNGRH